ncbi:hypothetical protein GTU73_09470 [Rathayibacter sp. VKM Ac-2804]|uniref:hypothetical protein n=1 Tax=Rathayibacter sp. VKM Ac-2804 TaxID=2609257 RepID=UPI00132EF5B5|nr:hypothetical protein [Rathayibacter sp. VKM Ac-2804]QHF24217.1 hypothetical protein GTU73_09470 [Rathayibacter sp. VKM Ac-2804]
MSTTNTQEPSLPKKPRTIELSVALPWFIVAVMTFALAGIITGWTLRSENVSQIEQAVAAASLEQRQ